MYPMPEVKPFVKKDKDNFYLGAVLEGTFCAARVITRSSGYENGDHSYSEFILASGCDINGNFEAEVKTTSDGDSRSVHIIAHGDDELNILITALEKGAEYLRLLANQHNVNLNV